MSAIKTGVGCFAVVGLFAALLAASAGFSCLMGLAASWVLAHFGVQAKWYVCSVAIWLVMVIINSGRSKK